jgi:peptide chain release factor 2|tara:strand:- start:40181 stop:41224 length:1044 start_codon:yes stop_codon:yes gene_type:complete
MTLGGSFDPESIIVKINEISKTLEDPVIWKDHKKLNSLNKEKNSLQKKIGEFNKLESSFKDIEELIKISEELNDEKELLDQSLELQSLDKDIDNLETKRYFSKEKDLSNAFLDIQAGSGGTEAQDWAEMLLRMYSRWAEDMGFAIKVEQQSPGDVAGIKSSSLFISGDYAYGWLRSETGIHRLVRKSPFDSGNRRHTSFAAVFASPELDEDIEIKLDMTEVRIDTYRASGAGGQHVNKTDSAVRLTHIPTGLVVQCQSQRSQHQNKDRAIKQLKSKLFELEQQKKDEEIQKLEDQKTDIGWGNQIRSYVIDKSRIKDIRTKYEETNTQAVLDGKINNFIKASLKNGY